MTRRLATPILVHGAWHNGTAWAYVRDELAKLGIDALAPDLPGHGRTPGREALDSHIEFIQAQAEQLADALGVVLVGHSYGGLVVSGAQPSAPRVVARVYIAAFTGPESVMGSYADGDVSPLDGNLVRESDGRLSVPPALARGAFYHDCSSAVTARALEELEPQAGRTLVAGVDAIHGQATEAVYVRCRLDRVVPTATQGRMSAIAEKVVSLDSGHSPMLSMPLQVAQIIATACVM